jgi:uncharacterized membrane protein (UPF0127 family)
MKNRTKVITLILIAFILVAGIVAVGYFTGNDPEPQQKSNELIINDSTFVIERATTQEERVQGLSGRESLAPGTGLLFVFDSEGDWGIWMKDMLISIDILWINSDKEVVHIEENISPDTYPTSFRSPDPALYVLEINAGEAQSADISVGDTAVFTDE